MDALAGQLRAATDLAQHATPAGLDDFAVKEARKPWTLQLAAPLVIAEGQSAFAVCRFQARRPSSRLPRHGGSTDTLAGMATLILAPHDGSNCAEA